MENPACFNKLENFLAENCLLKGYLLNQPNRKYKSISQYTSLLVQQGKICLARFRQIDCSGFTQMKHEKKSEVITITTEA